MKDNKKRIPGPVRVCVSVAFWLGIWELAAVLIGKELLFPTPFTVLEHLGGLVVTGEFWIKTGVSLARVMGGFLIGCLAGTALAVPAAFSEWGDAVISPLVRVIRSTPVASFIILVMLWTGYGFVPVVTSALMAAPVVFLNVLEGIRETDRKLLEVARVYRFGRKKTLRLIYLPSVRPYFLAGAVTSLGLAWKAGIAAEVLCLPRNAIGGEIYYSKLYLETADLFAWTAVVILLSFVLEKITGKVIGRKKE